MHQEAIAASVPWYRTLNREQWQVLFMSNLGWLFDGFEIYALFLTVGFALHQLLETVQLAALPRYAGIVLATTVFGWATGGVLGGIIADYIGRKRTMMLAILAYSLTTGLSAIAWNWQSFAILRFLVGVGIGSEWVTGASLVSELWPDNARGKGGGLLQSGAGIGSFLASGVWLLIGGLGPNAWRFMYLVGILPALLVLWLRRGMPGIDALGGGERAPPRRPGPTAERYHTRRRRRGADPLYGHRHVPRQERPPAAYRGVSDDAVGHFWLLGRCDLRSDLCRHRRRQGRAVGAVLLRGGRAARYRSLRSSVLSPLAFSPTGSAASRRQCCITRCA